MKAIHDSCYIDIEFDDGEKQCFIVDKDGHKEILTPSLRIKANGVLVEIPVDAFIIGKIKVTEMGIK